MKTDIVSSGQSNSMGGEPRLPADFAQRVLMVARKKLRRRHLRNRIATVAAALLLAAAIPLAALVHSQRNSLAIRGSFATAKLGWQEQSADDALAYQLALAATPRSAGDYLLPNVAALTGFASAYNEASWQYDPL
ncbi:MAG: hypothetical protein JO071_00500 [Deltaproteobacteria bacterium]|nr:hypothetical protein [Deltaproteobacteria bacterium]